MTDKQREIMDQVHEMLSEHFDAHVFVVDAADVDDSGNHRYGAAFNGGIGTAMGLHQYGIEKISWDTFHDREEA